MTDHWTIEYYNDELFEKWFRKLSKQGKFEALYEEIKLLSKAGNILTMPHSKNLGEKLYELRERSYGIRVYYTFRKGKIILLLNGGDKSSQAEDIKKARKLIKNLE
ncbi:type II toxin-antitoxin system RelE/ParE family toxin [Pigmentibacter ruber]|uniref:type II toxin-antitoxin system RelE/ParE family toxin n=1 Tax=Pigmentibacter ruber TaxID=2683196 RepID=UPI00131C03E3|nr:type II toxin-antitoxin system RelE/ParE family toxin [Pigmentibacter ruber]